MRKASNLLFTIGINAGLFGYTLKLNSRNNVFLKGLGRERRAEKQRTASQLARNSFFNSGHPILVKMALASYKQFNSN